MDNVFVKIGEFGWYQKSVYFLVCWGALFSGLYEMMSVITLYLPEHRCKIPGLENDTYDIRNANHQKLINKYIAPPSDDDSHNYDQCHLYSFDYNDVKFSNSNRPINASLVTCSQWVYSEHIIEETVSTKFNIVCSDTHLIPLVKSLYVVGKFIGAVLFGNLSDAIGRKTTYCVALMLMFGLTFGLSWSSSYMLYAVLTTAIGAATQGIVPVGMVFAVELVGPSKRKYTGLVFYFFSMGLIILPGIAFFTRHWYYVNIICSAPMVLFVLYWWLIPESPRWLISKHRYQDAYRVLNKIAKSNKVKIDYEIFEKEEMSEASVPTGRVRQLFSRSLILRTLVIMFNWCIVSMSYYGLSLNAGNLGGNIYLNMMLSGLVEIPAHTMSILLVDRVGRKRFYCLGMIFGGCACASTMIPIVYNEIENQTIVTTLAMVGKFGTTAAYDTIFLYSAELFPTVVRNAALGSSICAARIGGIVAPYIADSTALIGGMVGKIFPFGLFGFLSVIAGLSSLYLPETKKKTLPETMEDSKLLGKSSDMSFEDKESTENKYPLYGSNGYLSGKENTQL